MINCGSISRFATPLFSILSAAILFSGLCAQGENSETGAQARSSIRDKLIDSFPLNGIGGGGGPYFGEETAEIFAKKHGMAAAPVMTKMLTEDISPRLKAKVSFYFGHLEDRSTTHSAVVPITNLIRETVKAPIGKDQLFLLHFAMLGLGFTKNGQALSTLEKMAHEEFWSKCTFLPEKGKTIADYREDARSSAIGALPACGTQAALDILVKLRDQADMRDMRETVEEWIEECHDRISGAYLEKRKLVRPFLGK